MDENQQATRAVESVKLLSDFAKWLVTVATTAVAAVGYVLTVSDPYAHGFTRIIACAAVVSFALSIVSVTALLRSLPMIMRDIEPGQSIWDTEDHSPMRIGLSTAELTKLGTITFVLGVALVGVTLLVKLLNT